MRRAAPCGDDEIGVGGGDGAEQFPLKRAAGQHIEIGIDGFVRDARMVGSSGYRCGNPWAICSGDHRWASSRKTAVRKRGWAASLRSFPRLMRPALRPLVRRYRPIGQGRGSVAREFTRQSTRGTMQHLRARAETIASG